jgi:menaquinone-dependent protoporphyrinogen oxidase
MTRVLVVAASKHGSTHEIASRIADRLRHDGLHAVVSPPERVTDLNHFDAAIIGSAVYGGRWMHRARMFVEDNVEELVAMPVWLFSSGPLGADEPAGEVLDGSRLGNAARAREHRVFPGRLDLDSLGVLERFVARAVGASEGDFRDWQAVDEWTEQIGQEVRGTVPARSASVKARPMASHDSAATSSGTRRSA